MSSTWTLVIVAGWLWASTSLTDSRRRLRVMATEWAHPARILLYTGIGWAEKPATWITLGARCCCRAKESSVAGKPFLMAWSNGIGMSIVSKIFSKVV